VQVIVLVLFLARNTLIIVGRLFDVASQVDWWLAAAYSIFVNEVSCMGVDPNTFIVLHFDFGGVNLSWTPVRSEDWHVVCEKRGSS
jgi:hypothetical protein